MSCRQASQKGTLDPASSVGRGAGQGLQHGMHPTQGTESRILGLSVLLPYCLVPEQVIGEWGTRFSLKNVQNYIFVAYLPL